MAFDKIELTAYYGNDTKRIELSSSMGAEGGYHLYIDRYYDGTIVKLKGEWVGHMGPKSDLESDDIQILGDLNDGHLQNTDDMEKYVPFETIKKQLGF